MQVKMSECRDKVSPDCTQTFQRATGRGRPAVNCVPCRQVKKTSANPRTTVASPINAETLERKCGCGTTFTVKTGRGRKAEKCDTCREAGTVYRLNDDGEIQAIRAEQIKREEQDRRREAGKTRAMLLDLDMKKLRKKRGIES